ncbi:MAG TPA: FG-GAP and VCBS repeat-containing protein [Verrucomicrobiae bacterium]|nr:FG-GAP and VCBS repeat-containing protein [Verrucomicrobiae bacterium]
MKTFPFLLFATFATACSCVEGAQFKDQTSDHKIQIGYGLAIADVNGDQKPDLLLADKQEIVWYENPGWQKHVIAEKLTELDNVCLAAQDLDGDGKAEIAVGAGWNPGDTVNSGAVFYLVPPSNRTEKWKPVKLPHEPTVHRMWWVSDESGKYSLVVAPLHGRGNKNGAGEGVHLLEYQRPAAPDGAWTTKLIDDSMHMTHNLDPIQWDGDRAQEILFCGKEGILILDRGDNDWRKKRIAAASGDGFAGAGEVRLGQMKNDRFIAAIEPMHGTNVTVYTRPASGELWDRHILDSAISDGHAVATGDLLKKGADQIVIGWRGKNARGKVGVKIFTAKDPKGAEWTESLVDDNGMACEDLKVADLNGDGWLEIIAAGRATKNVKIYWNQGTD